jgi:superfamily II DNA or RNA helicase
LTYLHDAIAERNIATVGYYVGGMKESALKKTEEKQVVIATYAMAAEALDIKTLCTLIMVTPKTDIEQSVGRILRSDHEQPIVVDIVDSHDPFIKQWNKRKTFYKKDY